MNKRNLISSVMTILMPMFLFGQEAVIEEKVSTSIGGVVSDESSYQASIKRMNQFK